MDFLRQARVLAIIKKEPLLDKTQQMDLSHLDRFRLRVTRSKPIKRLHNQHKWDLADYKAATQPTQPIHVQPGLSNW